MAAKGQKILDCTLGCFGLRDVLSDVLSLPSLCLVGSLKEELCAIVQGWLPVLCNCTKRHRALQAAGGPLFWRQQCVTDRLAAERRA